MTAQQIATILVVLFVVWQIVTAIISHVNAQKQQQRAEEMARRRQQAVRGGVRPGGVTGGPAGGRGVPAGIDPEHAPAQSRLDELAARRQAQLEELRARRAGRDSGEILSEEFALRVEPRPEHQAGQRPGRQTSQRPMRIPPPPGGPRRPVDPWQARQEALRREREAIQRRRAEQKRQQQREAAERVRRDREAAARAKRAVEPAPAEVARDIGPAIGQVLPRDPYALPVQKASILARLRSRDALREALVVKELLDPPIALRPPEQEPAPLA